MWGSAVACKCFCATWPFLLPWFPLTKRRDSVCDAPQSSSHRWGPQHNWPIVASVLPLTPSLLLKSHPVVMLKPVPASQKGERRIVRLLWFQRCSRTHCPWRIWSWRTWKGYMNFGQRRKPNTKPDITDALGTPNYLSPFSYNFPRSTQTHLCEGDISAFELFTNKNLKFSILKAVWAMKHRYLFV